jgi:DNA/RNA-binding domain of Phe-tRNA-synthetase-like protein
MEVTLGKGVEKHGLIVGHAVIEGVENKKNRNGRIERLASDLEKQVKENPSKFLDTPQLASYERFINSCESAIESRDAGPKILIELVRTKGFLPRISRVVDCMNLVSIKSGLTMSVWDKDLIKGNIDYRLSAGGERYWPFAGEEVALLPGELAAFDEEKVLCLVRYRDSKYAPVTPETHNLVVHVQGVEGISKEAVDSAVNELEALILENTGGKTTEKYTAVSERAKP